MEERPINPFWFPTESKIRLWLALLVLLAICPPYFFDVFISLSETLAYHISQLTLVYVNPTSWGIWYGCLFISSLAAPASIALAIWHLLPMYQQKRFRLKPLSAHYPKVASKIKSINEDPWLRISPLPSLWWSNDPRLGNVPTIFGMGKRKGIVIPEKFLQLFDANSPHFESVILHELAHIKNGDVSLINFTRPFIYLMFGLPACFYFLKTSFDWNLLMWILPSISGIGYAVLYSYLHRSAQRKRELYADYRVKLARGDLVPYLTEALEIIKKEHEVEQMFLVLKPILAFDRFTRNNPFFRPFTAACNLMIRFWRSHPSIEERKKYIQRDPRKIFTISIEMLILISLALGSFLNSWDDLYNFLVNPLPEEYIRTLFLTDNLFKEEDLVLINNTITALQKSFSNVLAHYDFLPFLIHLPFIFMFSLFITIPSFLFSRKEKLLISNGLTSLELPSLLIAFLATLFIWEASDLIIAFLSHLDYRFYAETAPLEFYLKKSFVYSIETFDCVLLCFITGYYISQKYKASFLYKKNFYLLVVIFATLFPLFHLTFVKKLLNVSPVIYGGVFLAVSSFLSFYALRIRQKIILEGTVQSWTGPEY